MRALPMILAALAAALLAACGSGSSVPDYRYRLAVEVETPEGLKRGSSVIEVQTTVSGKNSIPTPGALRTRARGEAVAVDMPDGQTLYALLRSENESDWAGNIMTLLAPRYSGDDAAKRRVYAILRMRRERELPPIHVVGGGWMRRDGHPMLVTFADESDPTTIERVDPNDLAASFGEGVNLKRITVQATDDPVTSGIEQRLGWLIDPAVMENPGWGRLPLEARKLLIGLRAGKVGSER